MHKLNGILIEIKHFVIIFSVEIDLTPLDAESPRYENYSPCQENAIPFNGNSRFCLFGERGGSMVECRTPEGEVGGSKPTAAVLCP